MWPTILIVVGGVCLAVGVGVLLACPCNLHVDVAKTFKPDGF